MSGIIGKVKYLARRSLTMEIEILAVVGLDSRGYWRSLTKVIWRHTLIQLCIVIRSVFNYPHRSMGNGCWCVSSSIISHWAHDIIATLNQRHWRWFNVATTSCVDGDVPEGYFQGVQIQLKVSLAQSEIQLALTIFYYVFVRKIQLALTIFHQPRVTWLVQICIPDFRSWPKGIWSDKGHLSKKFDQVSVWSHLCIRRGMQLFIFICCILFQNQLTDTNVRV